MIVAVTGILVRVMVIHDWDRVRVWGQGWRWWCHRSRDGDIDSIIVVGDRDGDGGVVVVMIADRGGDDGGVVGTVAWRV